jgi:hypothetical protein
MKKIFYKIGIFFYNRIRVMFLKKKIYFGSYAENLIEMKRFNATERIIIINVFDERLKPTIIQPQGIEPLFAMEIMREQMREQSRKLRKKHHCELWYVEDHFLTRLFGFKPEIKI